MLVRLPSDQFLFDTGMSHLRKPSIYYLNDLGKFLGQNPDNFTRIEVTGHTDNRGKRRINQTLSTARAKTVRNMLMEGGVSQNKISYMGLAFDEPVDSRNVPTAWAKNRRTDLVFRGVLRPEEIERKVEELNDRYGRGEFNR
jgi:outer membrane protein OmpA-like peptidoglycan-associated protein